MEKDLKKYAD